MSGLSPIRQKPWASVVLLLALAIVFGASTIGPAWGQGDERTPAPELGPGEFSRAIPDLVVYLADGETFDDDFASLTAAVGSAHGVTWVMSDQTASPQPNLLVGLDPERRESGIRAVEEVVATHPRSGEIVVGGQSVVDPRLMGRTGRVIGVTVFVAALLTGAVVAWLVRLQHGAVIGIAVAVSSALGATIGGRAAGDFDGSLATTAVPALLAAILMSVFLSFRLLAWFAQPVGDDLADMIRRSVLAMAVELTLFFAGLVLVAGFLEVVGPGRSVATVSAVGAVTGTLITLAVVPPALAGLHGAELSSRPVAEPATSPLLSVRALVADRPPGRQFPVFVIVGFVVFFGLLSLLAVATPTVADLADRRGDDDDPTRATLYEHLAGSGGDPTTSILAVFPSGTAQLTKTAWLQRVSQLPSVGRVDSSVGRHIGGDVDPLGGSPVGEIGDVLDGDEAPRFALVVPTVPGRSEAARELVDAIGATNSPGDAELSGVPVDARRAADRDRSVVWVTMVSLAVMAGVATFALIGDAALAALATGLRLLDSMALVGIYHLVGGDVSGSELLILVLTTGLGMGLFELGFLRRLLSDHQVEDSDRLIERALSEESWAAAAAMIATALAAVTFVTGGTGALVRLGVVLVVATGIEIVIGLWLLRPAVLGTRAIAHFAAKPVEEALRSLNGHGRVDDAEHQRWVAVVAGLLAAEFKFQADPGAASIETVFQADTPPFHTAVEHHRSLVGAGLRIIGRDPQLRSVRLVASGPQATVAVAVDHPVRQLIDGSGKAVGVRKAERRSVILWLAVQVDGSYRIADSVELGAAPLAVEEIPAPVLSGIPGAALE